MFYGTVEVRCYPGGAVLLDVGPGLDDGDVAADVLGDRCALRPDLRPVRGLTVIRPLS